ncbi:DUF5707 domain-containing protein [Streptomyces sp. NPDC048428]|uniref:DUF5707 domain-containing protein n=1 Tax=Streptomyces sp. NPDC048428 TaxID=3154503 RepID=UPI00344712EE
MSKRALVPSLIGAVAIGSVAVGSFAMADTVDRKPVLKDGSVRYTAPTDTVAGTFTFTAKVSDDSGIRGLKVIAWPASSKLDPTEAELREVDDATCRSLSDETSRCTYRLTVTKKEAAELDRGTWYISALATANDGNTLFLPHAASVDITR